MSWPIKACLELGVLALAAFLWLSRLVSLAYWWQLASLWLVLVVVLLIIKGKFPVEGLLICGTLLILGWLFVLRIDPDLAFRHWRGIILGYIGFSFSLLIDWQHFRYKYISGVLALLLLLVTIVFGDAAGGAKAWLKIGQLRFQPIEIVRILLLLFLTGYFYDYKELLGISQRWPRLRYWGPLFLLMCGVFLFLAVQRDLGPALLFFFLFVSLVFYLNFNWYALFTYLLTACGGLLVAWFSFRHIRQRILIWINPWADHTGAGFQVVQGLFAVHNGGIFGRGLGLGLGSNLPAVHTDYIFALICEELGLIGATVLLVFYLLLLFFGLKIAAKLRAKSHILAIAIVLLWGYQIFIVIGGILKVIPLSGMTLPFINYGTTSIIANMCLLGILTRLGAGSSVDGSASSGEFAVKTKKVFVTVVALFAVLWGGLLYWQLFRPDLEKHPHNPRSLLVFKTQRGSIYDRHGVILASSDPDTYARVYHGHPSLTHTLGYFHPRYGITGLELAYNQQLANNQDLYLTIDAALQETVHQCFTANRGAVVVMQPQTGEILALYASPYIDPNLLDQNWEQYQNDRYSPFFNRAVNGVYPPGSSIKPLWLAAAYQTGVTTPDAEWQDQGSIHFGTQKIQNFNHRPFGHLSTAEALTVSSNVVFAQLAVLLKDEGLEFLQAFGLGASPGNLPQPQLSDFGWAQLGIGQGEILVTPLQMAAAISTIANRGLRMKPYFVQAVTGSWLTRRLFRPQAVSQVITGSTAAQVTAAMIDAVNNGTGQAARIADVLVAGKTGTAENAQGNDHAWFVGFAPADQPEIAVAVVVEHGGQGGGIATQIARQVIAAALERL